MTRLTKSKDTIINGPVEIEAVKSDVTVIIFNGPPGSGKDTLVDALCSDPDLKVSKSSFKSPMFKVAIALSGMTEEAFMQKYNDRDWKEAPWDELNGMSPRAFMIKISEEWTKPTLGESRFGYLAVQSVNNAENKIVLFSDGGFETEINTLKEAFGTDSVILVRLHRDGCTFDGDSRNYIEPGDCICLDLKLTEGQVARAVKALKRFIIIN